MTDYLFGDSDTAAQRLQIVADVFGDSTRLFLEEGVASGPALDLGCGPGHSTRLVADAVQPTDTVGLDASEAYIATARKSAGDRISFRLHDVTVVPFPTGPSDLIFCRLLLSHLNDPLDVVGRWATQLSPKGQLAIEEVESIGTGDAALSTYIDMAGVTLKEQGRQLYIGPDLDRMGDTAGLKRKLSRVFPIKVSGKRAAAIFYLNIQVWKHHPFVTESYAESTIDRLENDLKAIAEGPDDGIEVDWGLRQLVYQRP